ncbi:MAG: hypothetical protein HYU36_13295 [Planctomycetes bacterium]|nr:hypothetical protein [Planctomycetota bacterium]
MNPPSLASSYFRPKSGDFWRWSPDGQALVWNGEPFTIAFREEVQAVLERLSPLGLPPFNAVVLLFAACRDGWVKPVSLRDVFRAFLDLAEKRRKKPLWLWLPEWLPSVLHGLDKVSDIPPDLRRSLAGKAVLFEMVFEHSHPCHAPETARGILQELVDGLDPDALQPDLDRPWDTDEFYENLATLRRGLRSLDAEALRLRLRTGLDQLVEPAPLEVVPAELVRQLLVKLRDDPELSGLARLAQNLMATAHVPRPVSDPDEMPVGGISDISNRGQLERLLISELAHDDMTLAVRVALNEALYLRRETPPRIPAGRRFLLMDTGIRLWGLPRVFAAAAGLAFAANTDRHSTVSSFRAKPEGIEPVSLSTREGLVSLLEALESEPHPASSLPAFRGAIDRTGASAEAILVTHADVSADAEFLEALKAFDNATLYVATVERDGNFQLLQRTPHGYKLLREARLDLEQLLAPRPSGKPARTLIAPEVDPDLPLIFSVRPFPLQLPCFQHEYRAVLHAPSHGVVAVARNRRLLHWKTPGQGAREITAQMPAGPIHWLSVGEQGLVHLLGGPWPQLPLWLFSADLATGDCSRVEIQAIRHRVVHAFGRQGVLFIVLPSHLEVFSLSTGERAGDSLELPQGLQWRHGRFFFGPQGWHALAFDGQAAKLEFVGHLNDEPPHGILAVLDREGLEGPFALTHQGRLFQLPDGPFVGSYTGPPLQFQLEATSRDGHRVLLKGLGADGSKQRVVIDFTTGQTRRMADDLRLAVYQSILEPEIDRYTTTSRNLYKKFRGIRKAGKDLALLSVQGNKAILLVMETGHETLSLEFHLDPALPSDSARAEFRPFEPAQGPPGIRYGLRAARWPDGSRAHLDSRGLLHLKSSDPALPEISIVLAQGPLSGWLSSGKLCGDPYFTGGKKNIDASEIQDAMRRFIERLP